MTKTRALTPLATGLAAVFLVPFLLVLPAATQATCALALCAKGMRCVLKCHKQDSHAGLVMSVPYQHVRVQAYAQRWQKQITHRAIQAPQTNACLVCVRRGPAIACMCRMGPTAGTMRVVPLSVRLARAFLRPIIRNALRLMRAIRQVYVIQIQESVAPPCSQMVIVALLLLTQVAKNGLVHRGSATQVAQQICPFVATG